MTDNAAQVSPEKLTSVYIKMRDKRAALSAAFKAEDGKIKAQQEIVKGALLQYCKDSGLDSAKTEAGTISRSVKTTYWTSDWDAMYEFVVENNVPEFFSKSLNQTNVKEFLKDNPDIIPQGLNIDSEYVISIRKPTKKRGG